MTKIKTKTNKAANWAYQNKGKIISVVGVLIALGAGANWKYQDMAKKAKKEMPKAVEKIHEETDKRTNEFGEFKPWK